MDFSLTEEQGMLRTMARDFLETECPESFVRDMEIDEDGYSPEIWRKIADLGWLGLSYPEQYGGTGGNLIDLAVLHEEMGRAMFPSPYLSTAVLCGQTILSAGTDRQKSEFLPKIIDGNVIIALALTEPETSWDGKSWDPEGVTVPATADGDDYVINGTKLFVHDAHIADYLLVATRTREGATPDDGVTLFLVDARSPGISYTLLKTMAGDNKQSEVVFDNVRVPEANIVGELDGGWAPLARSLQIGAVMLCAEMVGAGQRILEISVDYAKTRIQFEMPIGINQFVQEYVVQLLMDVDGSRWATYLAAWKLNEGLDYDLEVAIAKAWTSDAHENACLCSHNVFGGTGSTEALHIMPLYTKRGNVAQFYLGDTSYHLKKIARELENLPPPEKPRGAPRGLWDKPREEIMPAWQPWRERWQGIQAKKEEIRHRKAERS